MKLNRSSRSINTIIVKRSSANSSVHHSRASISPKKVTFTKMTNDEHKNTRVNVYPYLIP